MGETNDTTVTRYELKLALNGFRADIREDTRAELAAALARLSCGPHAERLAALELANRDEATAAKARLGWIQKLAVGIGLAGGGAGAASQAGAIADLLRALLGGG